MSRISHIGIAVTDLDKSIDAYKLILGCEPDTVEYVADQKVKVAIFRPAGKDGSAIELICPDEDNKTIRGFLEKRGEGMHHLSLHVDDVAERLKILKDNGYRLIDEAPRPGAEGKKIAFIHPKSTGGVLLELEQN